MPKNKIFMGVKDLVEPIYTIFKKQLIQVGNTASERGIQQPI